MPKTIKINKETGVSAELTYINGLKNEGDSTSVQVFTWEAKPVKSRNGKYAMLDIRGALRKDIQGQEEGGWVTFKVIAGELNSDGTLDTYTSGAYQVIKESLYPDLSKEMLEDITFAEIVELLKSRKINLEVQLEVKDFYFSVNKKTGENQVSTNYIVKKVQKGAPGNTEFTGKTMKETISDDIFNLI